MSGSQYIAAPMQYQQHQVEVKDAQTHLQGQDSRGPPTNPIPGMPQFLGGMQGAGQGGGQAIMVMPGQMAGGQGGIYTGPQHPGFMGAQQHQMQAQAQP